ncbi:MAG: hypothetical protein AB2556_25040, partial [Candidatus Thiodiazotropha sp.]
AGSEVLFCCSVVRLGVGCMLHGHVDLLALVASLGLGKEGFPEHTEDILGSPAVAPLGGHIYFDPLELMERHFLDIYTVATLTASSGVNLESIERRLMWA